MRDTHQRWLLTLLHFLLGGLLFFGAGPRGQNYYTALRFAVCIGSLFIAHYWWRKRWPNRAWPLSVAFVVVAILFNPFAQFTFSKDTWSTIDLVLAGAFGLTAFAYVGAVGSLFWVGLLFACCIGLLVSAAHDVLTAVRLNNGVRVTGEIVTVDEQIEDCDSCSGRIRRTYDVIYTFQTTEGQKIESFVNVGFDPGYDPVSVIYNPGNPNESRLEQARQTTLRGAIVFGIIQAAIAAVLGFIGSSLLKDVVKEIRESRDPLAGNPP